MSRRAQSAPDAAVKPSQRDENVLVVMGACLLGFGSLLYCSSHGLMLLYGDAVAHLHIARRIFDSNNPGIAQLGGVWLPLPHLLLLPFVQKTLWWQTGLAGAWPSVLCYVASVVGLYRLGLRMLPHRWALMAAALFAVNPGLLYLSSTAMTEPLFLALLIWGALQTVEFCAAMKAGESRRAVNKLVCMTLLLVAAVYTRYDGWIFAAAAWCVTLAAMVRYRDVVRARVMTAFVLFTLLLAAAPVGWLAFNAHFFHDPLDFLRGPYSAAAIEKRTSPPGAQHYRGWHSPAWALLFYMRAAQVDAAAGESGFLVMALALAGLAVAFARKLFGRAGLALLWVPLPVYVYSIAYGSVPLFIPQLYPHSYYNSRYGLEMLPALALSACVALSVLQAEWSVPRPKLARALLPVAIVLTLASTGWLLWKKPLVLQEAYANSSTRIPFETALARQIEIAGLDGPIMMYNSDHVGALQIAGITLKQTVNEGDYDRWQAALADPATHAAWVIAIAGDPVDAAVNAHPQGLVEETVICTTGQPCARVFYSNVYRGPKTSAPLPANSF